LKFNGLKEDGGDRQRSTLSVCWPFDSVGPQRSKPEIGMRCATGGLPICIINGRKTKIADVGGKKYFTIAWPLPNNRTVTYDRGCVETLIFY
jgi:hypothetical protein